MTAQKGKDLLLKVDSNGGRELRHGGRLARSRRSPSTRRPSTFFGGVGLAALGAKVNDASQPAPQTTKSTTTR